VLVLTKADLVPDVAALLVGVASVAGEAPVLALSNKTGEGVDRLRPYLTPGRTVALIGSSGVGKSTLANRLLGEDLLATAELGASGRGRHTTTRRELVPLPQGGLLLDTPGMRELQLWEADDGLDEAFSDVIELAARCRFADCSHGSEPGCAVKEAVAGGRLPPERLASYLKLRGEVDELERRRERALRRGGRG
jgi:ribosome biogenesis GTPase